MKRRILLVDDEVAVLLTLKAVLEISGFDVDTAASGREGRNMLHSHQYHMVITDMNMESDAAGTEVIAAARAASYRPAIALLTPVPIADEDWQSLGADKMLVKPMHTHILLQQIEKLLDSHEAKLSGRSSLASVPTVAPPVAPLSDTAIGSAAKKPSAKRVASRRAGTGPRGEKSKTGKTPAKGPAPRQTGAKTSKAKRAAKAAKP